MNLLSVTETILAQEMQRSRPSRAHHWLLAGLAVFSLASVARAGVITFSGQITQSIPDGTGPAVNNPALNSILDFQAYLVTIAFSGSITAPGTYNLTGASLTFTDSAAPASETGFDFISLTIAANGGFDDLSLLGCLTTGSGCPFGNQLDANFQVPTASLNSQSVPATGLDPPHPLDLLEDDGTTDIQGSLTGYSYSGPTSAGPEPSSLVLLGCISAVLLATLRRLATRS